MFSRATEDEFTRPDLRLLRVIATLSLVVHCTAVIRSGCVRLDSALWSRTTCAELGLLALRLVPAWYLAG
jgi:hypothetical protein